MHNLDTKVINMCGFEGARGVIVLGRSWVFGIVKVTCYQAFNEVGHIMYNIVMNSYYL